MITMSSAYRTDWWMSSIPLSAILANKGLTTPPCGVPCEGYSGLTPASRHRKIPSLMPNGAMSRSMIDEWLILSKGRVEGGYYPAPLSVKSGRATFTASSFRFN